MKKGIWLIMFSVIFLAGCQSSRFMRDDMYFTSYDAVREVRQFEVAKKEKEEFALKREHTIQKEDVFIPSGTTVEDYYDFSYTARIRRFSTSNNSWAYYDPYYTNYYWFNDSTSQYFGHSIYSTYSWWGSNLGNNYNSNYWKTTSFLTGQKNWTNPWNNSWTNTGWWNPYYQFAYNGWNKPNNSTISWNNNFCFNNMYYNSKDNNCYWWWWQDGNAPGLIRKGNFAFLMQRNGVRSDVVQRPDINYTQIKADYEQYIANINANDSTEDVNPIDNSSIASKNSNSKSSNANRTANNSNSNNTNNTTNTSKRWDNYKADVNISPNSKDGNSNWSRSGVFSEGSRNNNYEFKGTIIQKKKQNDSQEGNQTLEKDPKHR